MTHLEYVVENTAEFLATNGFHELDATENGGISTRSYVQYAVSNAVWEALPLEERNQTSRHEFVSSVLGMVSSLRAS